MTVDDHGDSDSREFDLIEEEIGSHHVGNRTRSTALLAWFLETVWRLEPDEASDSICDGGGDKGIDALHVDEDAKEITAFQARHRTAPRLTQGDNDVKKLVGSAIYFTGPEGIAALRASAPNNELAKLVERLDLSKKLADGQYTVRLVFVTNARLDASGRDYVAATIGHDPALDVWSRDRLAGVAARTATLRVSELALVLNAVSIPLVADLSDDVRMLVGLVAAPELVRLPGIDDLSIFELNVRLGLGRTRINKELAATIQDPSEHRLFSTYHNGMTLLTRSFKSEGTEISLNGVSVVNGCQSLLALYDNRSSLTPSLQVLVRIVELGEQGDLVDRITYRTNNQNPVNIRDQRSTDKIQRDLQAQLADAYGAELGLGIRNGQSTLADATIENSFLAQLVMATYLSEPWNAVRKVKLFDQEYHRIFNRRLDAHKVMLLHIINEALTCRRSELAPELSAAFASVRFTLAYLVFRLIELTDQGQAFLDDPSSVLSEQREALLSILSGLAADAIDSTNYYVRSKGEERSKADELGGAESLFDAKVVFKSRAGVAELERDAIAHAKRLLVRDEHGGFRLVG